MIIDSSKVNMNSSYSKTESAKLSVKTERSVAETNQTLAMEQSISVSISEKGRSNFQEISNAKANERDALDKNIDDKKAQDNTSSKEVKDDARNKPRSTFIKSFNPGLVKLSTGTDIFKSYRDLKYEITFKLIEALTGRKVKMLDDNFAKSLKLDDEFSNSIGNKDNAAPNLSNSLNLTNEGGFGNINTVTSKTTIAGSYMREDSMSFSASVKVKTADGAEINLNLNLNMSQKFASEFSFTQESVQQLCDPLVFNFNGQGAALSDKTFSFDIDNDGKEDQISQLAAGNGFLALDLNEDGIINNGSELFGVKSGNGFDDLKAYDSDGNGWIDENDEIFNKLRIFTVNDDGSQQLVGLGEKGIGAIYLGNVYSDFEIRDDSNDLQGKISHTGFFLNEDYTAGFVQNVLLRNYSDNSNAAQSPTQLEEYINKII